MAFFRRLSLDAVKESLQYKFLSQIHFQQKKESFEKNKVIQIVKFLKSCDIFAQYPIKNLQKLALVFDEIHVNKGKTVYSEGEDVDGFYLIYSGEFQIQKTLNEKEKDRKAKIQLNLPQKIIMKRKIFKEKLKKNGTQIQTTVNQSLIQLDPYKKAIEDHRNEEINTKQKKDEAIKLLNLTSKGYFGLYDCLINRRNRIYRVKCLSDKGVILKANLPNFKALLMKYLHEEMDIFNQIKNPEMKRVAKKFNHQKFKVYFDTEPDKIKLYKSIQKKKRELEELSLKKEQDQLQRVYNQKLALSKSNSRESVVLNPPILHSYISRSQESSQSPDNKLNLMMRKAMISKLKDAINFMDQQTKQQGLDDSQCSRNLLVLDETDTRMAMLSTNTNTVRQTMQKFLLKKIKSTPAELESNINKTQKTKPQAFYQTMYGMKLNKTISQQENINKSFNRTQKLMNQTPNLPPRPQTHIDVKTKAKRIETSNSMNRSMKQPPKPSKVQQQSFMNNNSWSRVFTESNSRKSSCKEINIDKEISKLERAQSSLERLIMLGQYAPTQEVFTKVVTQNSMNEEIKNMQLDSVSTTHENPLDTVNNNSLDNTIQYYHKESIGKRLQEMANLEENEEIEQKKPEKKNVAINTYLDIEKGKIRYMRKTLNGFFKTKKLKVKLK